MEKAIRVLLVEDNPGDARLVQEYLSKAVVAPFSLDSVERLSAALKRLAVGGVDIVLLDLGLPDSQGLETLASVRAQAPDVPIIVVTGLDDRQVGLEAIRNGAQDYLVKGRVDGYLLGRALVRQIERWRAASGQPKLQATTERGGGAGAPAHPGVPARRTRGGGPEGPKNRKAS